MTSPINIPTQQLDPTQLASLARAVAALQNTVAGLAPGNPQVTNPVTSGVNVPQVAGLALVPTPNAIVIAWSPVSISDLHHYEVQVSASIDMSSPKSYNAGNATRFQYTDGRPATAYYTRVRAWNKGNSFGPWSNVLNTVTGLVTYNALAPLAATNPVFYSLSVFNPATISAPATQAYGSASINMTGGILLPFVSMEVQVTSTTGSPYPHISVALLVDGVAQAVTVENDVVSSVTNAVFTFGGGLGNPINGLLLTPIIGPHTLSVQFTLTAGAGSISITPTLLQIGMIELRQGAVAGS